MRISAVSFLHSLGTIGLQMLGAKEKGEPRAHDSPLISEETESDQPSFFGLL
jgi:hypothetical protein